MTTICLLRGSLVLLIGVIFSLYAIEPVFKSSQYSETLTVSERRCDEQILALNKRLAQNIALTEKTASVAPAGFDINLGQGEITLSKHEPYENKLKKISGIRIKKLTLFFSGNTLNKIALTIVTKQNNTPYFFTQTVIDPSPLTENFEDSSIITEIKGMRDELKVQDIENSITNPLRLDFKRNAYIPYLIMFADAFDTIRNATRLRESKEEIRAINRFRRTMRF